jgi:hypothetical protein
VTQHAINLLPDSIRIRSEAGIRTGRSITAVVAAVIVVVLLATHSRFDLEHARHALQRAQTKADHVLTTEATATELTEMLREVHDEIEHYDRIAHPIEVSAVLATVVNQLPPSIALDRIDIDAGARLRSRSTRSRSPDPADQKPRRVLNGELSGLAPTDQDIAELVAALDGIDLFRSVSLDFSRTRAVRGRSAREFRLSFHVDLESRYVVTETDAAAASPGEVANVE